MNMRIRFGDIRMQLALESMVENSGLKKACIINKHFVLFIIENYVVRLMTFLQVATNL